ncbi:hypothetical protein [Moheibacter sp.]|uniref:hypothetical protein n=1 Tax=Moheibacter sp. TaxID=1965316 RepID=UPI003C75D673
MNKPLFQETQRFTQWWLWLLLFSVSLTIYRPIYMAISEGQPLDAGQWVGVIILAVVILFMFIIRLDTRIDERGIYVKFFPVIPKFKFYSWEEISTAVVRKYSPLMEYGGWGIRFGRNGKAYNIKGNKGLQLKFKSGNALLIGTQKAEELEKVLKNIEI